MVLGTNLDRKEKITLSSSEGSNGSGEEGRSFMAWNTMIFSWALMWLIYGPPVCLTSRHISIMVKDTFHNPKLPDYHLPFRGHQNIVYMDVKACVLYIPSSRSSRYHLGLIVEFSPILHRLLICIGLSFAQSCCDNTSYCYTINMKSKGTGDFRRYLKTDTFQSKTASIKTGVGFS